jgi:hypothetical protein
LCAIRADPMLRETRFIFSYPQAAGRLPIFGWTR